MITLSKNKILSFIMMFLTFMLLPSTTQSLHNVEKLTTNLLKVDVQQLACMAKNIYHEAGAETVLGQAAIARVVLNRVRQGFADTPCKVIYQKTVSNENIVCQFSWVCDDKVNPNKSNPKFKQAERVAYEVMVFDMYKNVVPNTALFFHAINIDPLWPYKQVAKIGNHVFYSKSIKKSTDE